MKRLFKNYFGLIASFVFWLFVFAAFIFFARLIEKKNKLYYSRIEPTVYIQTNSYEIASLALGSEIEGKTSGKFFVGLGSVFGTGTGLGKGGLEGGINNKLVYYVYEKISTNEFSLVSVNAEGTRIVESNSKPKVEWKVRIQNSINSHSVTEYDYKIFVPVGSVVQKFDLGPN